MNTLAKYSVYMVFLLITLIGCAAPQHNGMHAPPEFLPYLVSFHQEALKRAIVLNFESVTVEFGPMQSEEWLAYCEMGRVLHIVVEPGLWASMSASEREQTIYHELGHCILKQGHRFNSIMAPYGFYSPAAYTDNRKQILDELFFH